MDPLPAASVLQRHADAAAVLECWDDDPDFANLDAIQECSPPYSTASTDLRRRESVSSRMSMQSYADFDDPDGSEHHLPLDESPASAISSAISAGIPIPEDVPPSALIGGSIKRLGTRNRGRKIASHDDWGEDLELPGMGGLLAVKKRQEFPASLPSDAAGAILSREPSPMRAGPASTLAPSAQLDKYRDGPDDDDDFFADIDDQPTLKISRSRQALHHKTSAAALLTPPLSEVTKPSPVASGDDDDFDKDFEFPAEGPLSLTIKTVQALRSPAIPELDTVFEWEDGQKEQGVEDGKPDSNVVSPSSVTAESEDEAPFDGLELPEGAFPDFKQLLEKRRQAAVSPMDTAPDFRVQKDRDEIKEEFFEGLEIGDGEIFDSKKLTLNRNVKHRPLQRKTSPIRRTAASLTFTTNRSAANQPPGRMNRLGHNHPTLLPPLPILEAVEERENQPAIQKRADHRPRRSGGAADHYRWSKEASGNIPPPPPIPQDPKPERRDLTKRPSVRSNRQENNPPTTTSAQLLRSKRSMSNVAQSPGPPSPGRSGRPPSRTAVGRPPSRNSTTRGSVSSNGGSRPPSSGSRPGSTNERPSSRNSTGRPGSALGMNRPKTPHSTTAKNSRSNISETRSSSQLRMRTTPRHTPHSSTASDATKKGGNTPTVAPERLRREAAAIGTLTQPTRKRNFGDGTELETFDDLPTSVRVENQYTVNPVGRGCPKAWRRNSVPVPGSKRTAEGMPSPQKKIDLTGRSNDLPRFARDTNASRNARAQTLSRLGMTTPVPESPPSPERWRKQIAARNTIAGTPRNRKGKNQKPHLIKPLGNISNLPKAAAANGMTYNPRTFRWEGNEKDLSNFDRVDSPTTPRPALITNVNQAGPKLGVQVVGGMVFDPQRMCWLKVAEDPEDESDPFEGLEDLVEQDMMSIDGGSGSSGLPPGNNTILMGGYSSFGGASMGRLGATGAISGEFVVGEEFDVGPQFVARQKDEEDAWRRHVDGWISVELAARPEARWALRELLGEGQTAAGQPRSYP